MKSKYHVRLMRPTFHRAILTVEAGSREAAVRTALAKAERLSEAEWAELGTESEPPVVEMVLSEEEEGDIEADVLEYVRDARYAYGLLQAHLDEGEGAFIAPLWLNDLPALAAADIAHDWNEALSDVAGEELEAFYAWLARQNYPSNVVDFFAERDKRGEAWSKNPDPED